MRYWRQSATFSAVVSESLQDEVTAVLAGERLPDPFPVWSRLREEQPVCDLGSTAIISRYANVKATIADLTQRLVHGV